MDHAGALARLYVRKYNTELPLSRLKYRPPLEFAMGQGMRVRREWYGCGSLARFRGRCPQTPGIYRIRPPVQEGNRVGVSRLPRPSGQPSALRLLPGKAVSSEG